MTQVKKSECAELRREEAKSMVDRFNPLFDKLSDVIHNIENKVLVNATNLDNISKSLGDHIEREETQQKEIQDTLNIIHKRVTENAITRVSKAELRWIIWILVTGFTMAAWYMITQIDNHTEEMRSLNNKLYHIESNGN